MLPDSCCGLIQKLAKMNSLALSRLWQGQEEDAICLLTQGLQRARCALKETNSKKQAHPSSLLNDAALISWLDLDGVMYDADIIPQTQSRSGFLYYRKVFVLKTLEGDDPSDDSEMAQDLFPELDKVESMDDLPECSLPTLCALLAYNLAIIYHENGLVDGDFQTISKAASFYKLALVICGHYEGINAHLTLAVCTNGGHVAAIQHDLIVTDSCRRGLEMTLNRFEQARGCSANQDSSPDWAPFFRQSLALCKMLPGSHAPAA